MTTTTERADLVRRGMYGQRTQQVFQECPGAPLPDWNIHTGSATNEELATLVRAVGQLAQHAPEILAAAVKGKTIVPTQVMDAMELLAVQPVSKNQETAAKDMACAWEALWDHRHIKKKDPSGRQRLRAALVVDLMSNGKVPIRNTQKFLAGLQETFNTQGTTVAEEGFRFLLRCSLDEISPGRSTTQRPRM